MVRFRTLATLALTGTLSACAAARTPVQVVGPSADMSALVGEWAGEYSSVESGRSGSISFTLRSAGDTAFGDVVMIPRASGQPLTPWRDQNTMGAQASRSTVLSIRFVRVQSGHVSGTLDPYADPETGARLVTTFAGELQNSRITGTYTTRLPSGGTQTGRWSVERR